MSTPKKRLEKRRKEKTTSDTKERSKAREPSSLLLAALVIILLLSGFLVKLVFFPSQGSTIPAAGTRTSASQVDQALEGLVQLVSLEFRCACGGCGEMDLFEFRRGG